jgi:hypothetical protein
MRASRLLGPLALTLSTGLLAVACSSTGGSPSPTSGVAGATGTPGPSGSAGPSESAAASSSPGAEGSPGTGPQPSIDQIIATFAAEAGSEISGGTFLTDVGGGQTAVTIGVIATKYADKPIVANIHRGTCDSPEKDVAFPLSELAGGASNTVIDATLDELSQNPHVVTIEASKSDATVLACAEIKR